MEKNGNRISPVIELISKNKHFSSSEADLEKISPDPLRWPEIDCNISFDMKDLFTDSARSKLQSPLLKQCDPIHSSTTIVN